MNKTIIANWGHAKQGKSATVKKVAQLLMQQSSVPFAIDYSSDIREVIIVNGIKYGIESQGDPNSRLFSSLEYFAQINCDFIICSTRTSGATVDAVSDMYNKYGYDIIWVTNHRSNEKNKDLLNQLSANQIIELINNIIAGNI